MAEESAVNYWHKFGQVAFDTEHKAVLTSCVLRYQPVVSAQGHVLSHQPPATPLVGPHSSMPATPRTVLGRLDREEKPGREREREERSPVGGGQLDWRVFHEDAEWAALG